MSKGNGRKWINSVVFVIPLAMAFHENLHDLAVKEGLKGRKLHKSVESFTWNITILKVPCPHYCCQLKLMAIPIDRIELRLGLGLDIH